MGEYDEVKRAVTEVAEPLIEGMQLRVAQQIRQFHRIGRSRTAGCRRVAERALRDTLETVRDEVVDAIAVTDPARLDDPSMVAMVTGWLERCASVFEERFRSVLAQTEGYDRNGLGALVEAVSATVAESMSAARERVVVPQLPSFEWLPEPTRGAVRLWSRAAWEALAAEAMPAAAVAAARALELLLSAPGGDRAGTSVRARSWGVELEELEPMVVLRRDPVPDGDMARTLVDLVAAMAEDHQADGNTNEQEGENK